LVGVVEAVGTGIEHSRVVAVIVVVGYPDRRLEGIGEARVTTGQEAVLAEEPRRIAIVGERLEDRMSGLVSVVDGHSVDVCVEPGEEAHVTRQRPIRGGPSLGVDGRLVGEHERYGVVSRAEPYSEQFAARTESSTTSNTFGEA
jgi:hypothetical protein